MTDNIFEIETTAITHVFVLSEGNSHSIDGLCCCFSQRQSIVDALCDLEDWIVRFSVASCEVFTGIAITHVEFWHNRGESLWSRVYDKVVQRAVLFLQWLSDPFFNWIQETYPKEPWQLGILAAYPTCLS